MNTTGQTVNPTPDGASIGELVLNGMGSLSSAERRVARALLAAYPIAGLETVAKLASRANVSGPTVVRFVAKLGFGGYPEFQEALHEEVHARISSPANLLPRQPIDRDGVLASIEAEAHNAIGRTFAQLPRDEFQRALDLLADGSRTALFTGGRYSQVLAFTLFENLHSMRPRCRLVGSGPVPRLDELIDVKRGDVVAVFDFRRYQPATLAFARGAAARGAAIVLITDPWLSPIASVAECVLPASVDAASPFDSFVPAMAVIEAIVAGVSLILGPKVEARFEQLDAARSVADQLPDGSALS